MKFFLITASVFFLFLSCSKAPNSTPKNNGSSSTSSQLNIVSTFAGNGLAGFQNGTALSAEFNEPASIVEDASGNLFVDDLNNNVIRKITPDGIVSTYAGTGKSGLNNGPALSATFNTPDGLAIDASGNMFVDDLNNNVIRKITPDGIVSTYAGTGIAGFKNGQALTAQFNSPRGIAVDINGNLFISDTENNKIREITPDGIVSTYAGSGTPGSQDGPALSATFSGLFGLTTDAFGNLYAVDSDNNLIRKITTDRIVTTYAGSVNSVSSIFDFPKQITIDASGNLYVGDGGDNEVKKVSTKGIVTVFAGTGYKGAKDGDTNNAQFSTPFGIVTDATGNFYVTDVFNNEVRKITVKN